MVLLKLYIYGYLNRVQSSRRLEREAQRNVELMWLTGRLAPDFKTIADVRHDKRGFWPIRVSLRANWASSMSIWCWPAMCHSHEAELEPVPIESREQQRPLHGAVRSASLKFKAVRLGARPELQTRQEGCFSQSAGLTGRAS